MKKHLLSLLLILMACSLTFAQQPFFTVKGFVVNLETGTPVAGQPVYIVLDSVYSAYSNKAVTDENGLYTFQVPYFPITTQGAIVVYTYDCQGMMVQGAGYLNTGVPEIIINLSICGNSIPGCRALFKYMIQANDMLSIAFYDGSSTLTGSAKISYAWNFGDSITSTEQNPVHSYGKPGVYNVCLSIKSSDPVCSSIICLPVTVGSPTPGPCESSFGYYFDSISQQYVFEGLSLNQQATGWKWDFGDGTSASGQKVTHIFNSNNGSYTVCLISIVASADGTVCTSTSCQDLLLYNPSPCESSFWYQPDSISGTGFIFEGYAKNNQISSWKWDFGDGTTASGQKVSHSFASTNANPTVCLTTTGVDSSGDTCTHSACQNIYIYIPTPCESSFKYYPDSTGSFTFEGYAKNSQVDTWMWDFGDGTTATGQKVSHTFPIINNVIAKHYVCLTTSATGASGVACTFSSCQDVNINIPSPCDNYFKAYSEDGFTYTFSGAVASGANPLYYWNFGDGTSDTGQLVTHAFGKINSTFNVCLTTVMPVPGSMWIFECKSVSCQTISTGIDNPECKAVFSAIPDSTKNTYRFQTQSQKKYSYSFWDFGDGIQSFEVDVVHTYSSPGIYIACLTVVDSIANCSDKSCQEIWVDMIQPGCQASFTVVQADSSNSTTSGFMFFNTSAPGYTNQKWSFGDGTGSYELNPVHLYNLAGVYNACLTIWDSLGKCQSNYCMDIYAGKIINDNTVSGIVIAGNKVADHGLVWLISPNNNYNAELQIDSTGIYRFTGVPYGKYYIYAMLTPGSAEFFGYMPTYYASSLSWQGATLISTGEPNAWYQISLIPSMFTSYGNGVITGTVNWGGIIIKAGNDPMANVEVVLYNSDGNPVAYTFTNSQGTFEFNGLAFGEYTLQAEMPGKATQLIPVSLSENAASANIDFIANSTEIFVLGLNDRDKAQLLAGNPYPDPAGENLYIKLNASATRDAVADIIDVQGNIVRSESIALPGGNNLISISTGGLSKGIYMLRIKSEGYKPVYRKFIR